MSEKSKRVRTNTAKPDDPVQSFIEELRNEPSDNHTLHGVVKPAETDDGLMFALPNLCEHWIYLPATAIQAVRRTGRIACKGHSYVSAEIRLKAPDTESEKTLADIARLHQASLLQLQQSLPSAASLAPNCPIGTSWKQNEWGTWGCWP
jgi:hypothetical protein